MDFAYVTFVNNNETYINLMKSTIKSVEVFSNYPIIVYCVDIPLDQNHFIASERCILRNVRMADINNQSIYYMKPYIIIDAIHKGLKSGYYIESDDLLTPCGDSIVPFTKNLDAYPISPIHPDDVIISEAFMKNIQVTQKTQHYIHAHVLFKHTNLHFLQDWLANCLISQGENWDESVLNCMYWKNQLSQHYLEIIDPWYQLFYKDPAIIDKVITLHGCKNPVEHANILEKMIAIDRDEKVSVVIPTYNRFSYLQNTIQSIRNQTYKNIEIIVVNDCSTQPEYYTYDWPADIKIIHLEKNSKALFGYACAAYVRNQGINAATGKYIAFCDDDDSWFPTKVELQIKAMRETGCKMSSTDALVGNGVFSETNNNTVYSNFFNSIKLPEIWTLEIMKKSNYMICSSVIIEKNILTQINNFNNLKPPGEDYDCWLRALEHTNSVYVRDVCVYYDMAHGDGRHYEL